MPSQGEVLLRLLIVRRAQAWCLYSSGPKQMFCGAGSQLLSSRRERKALALSWAGEDKALLVP